MTATTTTAPSVQVAEKQLAAPRRRRRPVRMGGVALYKTRSRAGRQ